MTSRVAVIGLGSMGYGMAASLRPRRPSDLGHRRGAAQAERFRGRGRPAGRAGRGGGRLDAVVVVVLNAAQTESVLFGADGLVPRPARRARW